MKLPKYLVSSALVFLVAITATLYYPFTQGDHSYLNGRKLDTNAAGHLLDTGTLQFRPCIAYSAAPSTVGYKAYVSPLWPLITAAAIDLHGATRDNAGCLILIELGLQLLTGLLLFAIYRSFIGGTSGAIALMALFYFFHGFFDLSTESYVEPLYTFFLALFTYLFLRAWLRPTRSHPLLPSLAAGVALGLTILTKPTLFYLVIPATLCSLVIMWMRRKRLIPPIVRVLVPLGIMAYLTVLPWAVRNYFALDRHWVFSATNTGINLYQGAVERFPLGFHPERGRFIDLLCSPAFGTSQEEIERSRSLRQLAWSEVKDHPLDYLKVRGFIFLKETLIPSLSLDYTDAMDPSFRPNHQKAWFIPQFPRAAEFLFALLFIIGVTAAVKQRHLAVLALLGILVYSNAVSSLPHFKLRYFLPYLTIYFTIAVFGLQTVLDFATQLTRRASSVPPRAESRH